MSTNFYKGFGVTLLENGGYLFEGKGIRMLQDTYFPFKGSNDLESAQLHIDAIIAEHNAEPQPSETELLRQELADTKQQLAETQDALIELANLYAGGTE